MGTFIYVPIEQPFVLPKTFNKYMTFLLSRILMFIASKPKIP